jgi:hypothetical protein
MPFEKSQSNHKNRLGGMIQIEGSDATGRRIRDEIPAPHRKPFLTAQERKESIIQDTKSVFKVFSNNEINDSKPIYALEHFSEVKKK